MLESHWNLCSFCIFFLCVTADQDTDSSSRVLTFLKAVELKFLTLVTLSTLKKKKKKLKKKIISFQKTILLQTSNFPKIENLIQFPIVYLLSHLNFFERKKYFCWKSPLSEMMTK